MVLDHHAFECRGIGLQRLEVGEYSDSGCGVVSACGGAYLEIRAVLIERFNVSVREQAERGESRGFGSW